MVTFSLMGGATSSLVLPVNGATSKKMNQSIGVKVVRTVPVQLLDAKEGLTVSRMCVFVIAQDKMMEFCNKLKIDAFFLLSNP